MLLKCIAMGALSFPTPFLMFSFLFELDPGDLEHRFLVISILLLSGALIGLASFYKDSAMAALKDWYPSDRPAQK